MPLLAQHKAAFLKTSNDCRAVFQVCLAPRGQYTDPGIEASFLQLYKAWESFLEDCTLSFLCGRLRTDGTSVPTHTISRAEDSARKILYQERPYLEWSDADVVGNRWSMIFVGPNPLSNALIAGKAQIRHMTTVRNAIAHSSPKSKAKFADLVQSQFGGRRNFTRPAHFLNQASLADPTMTYFEYYSSVLETLAATIAGP